MRATKYKEPEFVYFIESKGEGSGFTGPYYSRPSKRMCEKAYGEIAKFKVTRVEDDELKSKKR